MAVFRTAEKFSIWTLRFLQLVFGIILVGTFGWFLHIQHHDHLKSLTQVTVPLAFSCLAVVIAFFSIISVCFLGRSMQWVAAFLDLITFIGYLASIILYRHNYHIRGYLNQLRNYLIGVRYDSNKDSAHIRITNLVRLGAALILIQLILFFITTILSMLAARSKDRSTTVTTTEKRGMFGRGRRVNDSSVV